MLIVDDNPFVRIGLRLTLSEAEDLEVVGEAADGAEAIQRCRDLLPNLVIMDLRMPVMDGLQATTGIKAAHPGICVIVMSVVDVPEQRAQATAAGADAFLTKDAEPDEVLQEVRRVLHATTHVES
jgi:DNA-binding NarL/FixJ family response regulator